MNTFKEALFVKNWLENLYSKKEMSNYTYALPHPAPFVEKDFR